LSYPNVSIGYPGNFLCLDAKKQKSRSDYKLRFIKSIPPAKIFITPRPPNIFSTLSKMIYRNFLNDRLKDKIVIKRNRKVRQSHLSHSEPVSESNHFNVLILQNSNNLLGLQEK